MPTSWQRFANLGYSRLTARASEPVRSLPTRERGLKLIIDDLIVAFRDRSPRGSAD